MNISAPANNAFLGHLLVVLFELDLPHSLCKILPIIGAENDIMFIGCWCPKEKIVEWNDERVIVGQFDFTSPGFL